MSSEKKKPPAKKPPAKKPPAKKPPAKKPPAKKPPAKKANTGATEGLLSQTELANLPMAFAEQLDTLKRPPQFVRITEQPDASMIAKLLTLPDLQSIISSTLTSFPTELCGLPRLQSLHLENAPLTALPDEIGNLKQLRFLSLGYCTALHTLPEGLAGCENLFRLDVRFSGLRAFPKALRAHTKLRLVQMYGLALPASAVTDLAPKAKVQQ